MMVDNLAILSHHRLCMKVANGMVRTAYIDNMLCSQSPVQSTIRFLWTVTSLILIVSVP